MSTSSTLRSTCRAKDASLATSARSLSPGESLSRDVELKSMITSEFALHDACRQGNVDDVSRLLEGANLKINSRDQLGRTALHFAAAGGHCDVIKLLTSFSTLDINAADHTGMTPVLWAAWCGHVKVLQQLVNHGADLLAINLDRQTVLHCAVVNSHVTVVNYLINSCLQRIDINAKDKRQRSVVHVACEKGSADIVDRLLDAKSNGCSVDKYGWLPVHTAALRGHETVLSSLLLHGLEVNIPETSAGCTCLHLAAGSGHDRVVLLLLSHHADINAINAKGQTALMVAACAGHVDCVRHLVEHHADINATNRTGNTALHLAAVNNHAHVVQQLVSVAECDVSRQNERQQTALHAAIEQSSGVGVIDALLKAGTRCDVTDKGGRTALGLASRASMIGIVDLLITAERYQFDRDTADRLAADVRCTDVYHHCFYQTAGCTGTSHPSNAVSRDSLPGKRCSRHVNDQLKDVLWKLATKNLRPTEWKKLAKHWNFSDAQVHAIEHQFTGDDSYKQHGYRLLVIWLKCLRAEDNPVKQLFIALDAISRRDLAEDVRSACSRSVVQSKRPTVATVVSLTRFCSTS